MGPRLPEILRLERPRGAGNSFLLERVTFLYHSEAVGCLLLSRQTGRDDKRWFSRPLAPRTGALPPEMHQNIMGVYRNAEDFSIPSRPVRKQVLEGRQARQSERRRLPWHVIVVCLERRRREKKNKKKKKIKIK